jgi:formate dehydrogenase accessory protein FdhE
MVRPDQERAATHQVIPPPWARRISRANERASAYPFAVEGLRFYAQVAGFQRNLYLEVEGRWANSSPIRSELSRREELDLAFFRPHFSRFLTAVSQIAPQPLSGISAELARGNPVISEQVLQDFWRGDSGQPVDDSGRDVHSQFLLAWTFLQPYAEYLANRLPPPAADKTPPLCPLCGSKPMVGVLRPEGDGARKSLICMLCAHEWAFRRLLCPACGEGREPQLAFYSTPEIAQVRVDVCDTCHTYVKSVDLTKIGIAVPVVDELATIPLDLWARAHGYEKLQSNLLGI